MRKKGNFLSQYFLILLAVFFLSCSSSKDLSDQPTYAGSSPAPERIYQPKFYIYKKGKYRFVRGAYERIIDRKAYRRRSLSGYTYKKSRSSYGYASDRKKRGSSN